MSNFVYTRNTYAQDKKIRKFSEKLYTTYN